jgi:hypothetical protein
MKKIVLTILTITILGQVAIAQLQQEDVAIAQSLFSKKKKETISSFMKIDASPTNGAFWKLYDEYEVKRNVIMKERFYLLNEYSQKYATLDDASASKLAEGFMKGTEQSDKLSKQYYKKFKKLIGGLQATTLFQIELYIQTATQANLQTQVPIIGELQKIQELQQGVTGF